jgi:hypothetical protein
VCSSDLVVGHVATEFFELVEMFLGEFIGDQYLHDGLLSVKEKYTIEQSGGGWQARFHQHYSPAMQGNEIGNHTLAMWLPNRVDCAAWK